MSTINLRHEAFIQQMILHGDRRLAYQIAYPESSDRAAYNNAGRLLQRAEIKQRIRDAAHQAQETATDELKQQCKQKILDNQAKRAALYKIVMGKTKVKKVYKIRGHKKTVWNDPTPSQVLAAIHLDSKIEAEMMMDIYKRTA